MCHAELLAAPPPPHPLINEHSLIVDYAESGPTFLIEGSEIYEF